MRWLFGRRRPDAAGAAKHDPVGTKATGLGAGFVALHREVVARWSPAAYPGLAREGYMRNPVGYRCVRLIAEAAAAVPFLLRDGRRQIDRHPLLDLVARPNPRQSGTELMETLYGHLLLAGNAYVEAVAVEGTLRELHALRPDRMRIVEGRDGWPEAYEYRTGATLRRYPAAGAAAVPLLHMRLFHPLDDHYGLAPLAAAHMALDLHNAAGVWNKALLDNSARPSGALVYQPKEGGNLSEDQYQRLKEELEDGYAGTRRAGRPLLLEGGLDWKAMSLSPREMDFVEARSGASRDIALALGVPPMLLGIPGDNTYANYQEANRAFFRLTVLPLLARTAAALGPWLIDAAGNGGELALGHDLDRVPGLAAEREALWRRIGAAPFLTEAEKREAVGYPPDVSRTGD